MSPILPTDLSPAFDWTDLIGLVTVSTWKTLADATDMIHWALTYTVCMSTPRAMVLRSSSGLHSSASTTPPIVSEPSSRLLVERSADFCLGLFSGKEMSVPTGNNERVGSTTVPGLGITAPQGISGFDWGSICWFDGERRRSKVCAAFSNPFNAATLANHLLVKVPSTTGSRPAKSTLPRSSISRTRRP